MNKKQIQKFIQPYLQQELARRYFRQFVLYVDEKYQMNWHHRLICDYLEHWLERDLRRLMIFTAPRHGKSELVSRKLPAYLLGRFPDSGIIACSYNAELAGYLARDVRRILEGKSFQQLFPKCHLASGRGKGSFVKKDNFFEIVQHKGFYRCAGVGGGITGMGADFIIIDDPVKNRDEANSVAFRDRLWEWFTSTLYTRLEGEGAILLTLTRWHEDDLAGRILEQMSSENKEKWTVLSLPAICEEKPAAYDCRKPGEALWPKKFDIKRLDSIRQTIGSYDWSALYQQKPQPLAGGLFKRNWWKYWQTLPGDLLDYIQSWDCAFKNTANSDFVVGQVWARVGANRYLLDQVRGKMSFSETLAAMRLLSSRWPQTARKLVEDKANGSAVIDTLKNEISGIIPVQPAGGKTARAQAVSAAVEAGNVYLPDFSRFAWVGDLVEELAVFPQGSHDDQVDALTQANIYYNEGLKFDFANLIS